MKIVFIGGVEIGLSVLEGIYESGFSVDTVFTHPEGSKASGYIDFEPFIEGRSEVIRTEDINKEVNKIKGIDPDLIIVCGWQRLVCEEILNIPELGTIGFHSSLLPKYRGRAPVNWAIIMGEKETGITMFYLTPEADTGDIIAQKSFPILLNDDCNTIYQKSAQAGCEIIKEYLPKIKNGTVQRIHNPSKSYPAYPKRTPEDGLIDFNRSAIDVYNVVRALTKPYPGAFYFNEEGEKIIVWKIGIIFDDYDIQDDDIIIKTQDLKIKVIDYELGE